MSKRPKRRSYFVDRKVQGALLACTARYWALSVTVVAALTILGWIFITPGVSVLMELREELPSLLGAVLIAFLASFLVLPVILFDLVRVSNRFVGPVLRLKRSMQQAAAGESVNPVRFRDEDYWQDFADAFNHLLERFDIPENSVQLAETNSSDSQEPVEIAG